MLPRQVFKQFFIPIPRFLKQSPQDLQTPFPPLFGLLKLGLFFFIMGFFKK